MEAILTCHPSLFTELLNLTAISCELWRIRTGPMAIWRPWQASLQTSSPRRLWKSPRGEFEDTGWHILVISQSKNMRIEKGGLGMTVVHGETFSRQLPRSPILWTSLEKSGLDPCGTKLPSLSEELRFTDSAKSPSTKIDGVHCASACVYMFFFFFFVHI